MLVFIPVLLVLFLTIVNVDSTTSMHSVISQTNHNAVVNEISALLQSKQANQQIVLQRNPGQSHCSRPHDYKINKLRIDMSDMTKIIGIETIGCALKKKDFKISDDLMKYICTDSEKSMVGDITHVVEVQAMASMESLVDALLPYGLVPCVVPEFKGITIGGSIQGLAAESSSFIYGFVHNVCVGYECILSNGNIMWCSSNTNAELYHSIPGSFGTVALISKVKVLCMKASEYVEVTCKHHSNSNDCVRYMGSVQDKRIKEGRRGSNGSGDGDDVSFMEGIAYSESSCVSIHGRFIDGNIINTATTATKIKKSCNKWSDLWFYNQINRHVNVNINKSNSSSQCLIYSTKDYLFRHDRGSFWMASYKIPQLIGRFMGKLLDSTNMFKLATALPLVFPKDVIMLQDFMLPRSNVIKFLDLLQKKLNLWPIWLLPMRNIKNRDNLFAAPDSVSEHLCNVGAYGIPACNYPYESTNKYLEDVLCHYNGRKVYYSSSYFKYDYFYNHLYNGKKYFQLRDKYHATNSLPDIYDKIITKNNRL